MNCLGCEAQTSNRGGVCDTCLPVLEHDWDRWTFNHPDDVALRQKIQDARRGFVSERDLGDENAPLESHCNNPGCYKSPFPF